MGLAWAAGQLQPETSLLINSTVLRAKPVKPAYVGLRIYSYRNSHLGNPTPQGTVLFNYSRHKTGWFTLLVGHMMRETPGLGN